MKWKYNFQDSTYTEFSSPQFLVPPLIETFIAITKLIENHMGSTSGWDTLY